MGQFKPAQWDKIFNKLDSDEKAYGLPQRRSGSLVFASFNIRKFGRLMKGSSRKRSEGSWNLLVQFFERCDFVAIQEVMDDLTSLKHLVENLGGKYDFLVSDIAGGVPGNTGSSERLAFVYRKDRITPTGLGSDISFERSSILRRLYDRWDLLVKVFEKRDEDLDKWNKKNAARLAEGKGKRPKPPFVLDRFIQFIRSPHIASFHAKGVGEAEPYKFLAVNAHLLYGNKSKQKQERWWEFMALMQWLITRAPNLKKSYEPNIFLFGDFNLDFEKIKVQRPVIDKLLKDLNKKALKRPSINLPFLDAHPEEEGVFRTNARRNQTYDQIGLIASDRRLPPPHQNDEAGKINDRYDYGMFNFVKLFLDAVPEATKANGKPDYGLFDFDVSDHMPIWVRLQKPVTDQHKFIWR